MVEQMHEQGISIPADFYRVVQALAKYLQLPEQYFIYAKKRIT